MCTKVSRTYPEPDWVYEFVSLDPIRSLQSTVVVSTDAERSWKLGQTYALEISED